MQIANYINGEFSSLKSSFNKLNPYTHEIVSTVQNSTTLDVVTAVQGAQKAFSEWKNSSLQNRIDLLKKIEQVYSELKNQISLTESLDQGLPLFFTKSANVDHGLELIKSYAAELNQGAHGNILQPVGVVAVILSWNLSNRLFIERVIPALMAGNAVIVKFSSLAPSTALVWAQIFQQVGLPKGLVQFLHGNTSDFKNILVSHPGIKAISAVGNLKTTSTILKKTAELSQNQFKKLQLSSGTKNSAISFNEPTEKRVREILESFLIGQGQLAWNSARLFILEKHETLWRQAIKSFLATLRPSLGIDDLSIWTPLLRSDSMQTFKDLLVQSEQDQAQLLRSDIVLNPSEGSRFLSPTFTENMSNCSTLQQDEVGVPLFILSTVKYPFDVPKYSNVSYYGFAASIWGDAEKSQKVIDQLDVGLVSLNKWCIYSPVAFVPVKQSAFGVLDYRIFGNFFNNVKVVTSS